MVLTRAASADPLSPEGFDRLLALLDQDRDRAGLRYEALRRKLLRFFEWRNCRPAEELADETLDRVCRKLGEGLQIRVPNPCHYVYGVARNVAREATVRAARTPHATALPEQAEAAGEPMGPGEVEPALDCLDRCLEALPLETRQLLLLYYSGEGRADGRRRIAEGLNIPVGALWVRMHRLRKRLESCVRDCLASEKGKGPHPHSSMREEGQR